MGEGEKGEEEGGLRRRMERGGGGRRGEGVSRRRVSFLDL